MCWQLVACILCALVEGDNIGPQDVCWANADRARAPLRIGVYAGERGRLGVASCSEAHLVHMFAARQRRMVPDHQNPQR
jgi:hypothetical protein